MSDRSEPQAVPIEPTFDRTPQPFGNGLPDPIVYDGSSRAVRQRTVNFAAKRYADMLYVSGLDRETADRHFRWRAVTLPGGLTQRPAAGDQAALVAARAGQISIETDNADRRVTVTWNDPAFGGPIVGAAIARPNYGGILLGPHAGPAFDPTPIERHLPGADLAWPLGAAVEPPAPPPVKLVAALKTFFANSTGVYGILIASPERILVERYSAFGAPDRATPSWSMTKAITCTVIGRLINEGWLASVYDPAPAPLWRDQRAIHHQITLDHLLRMRSGLAFPVMHDDGSVTLGFENSAVYQDAGNAFEAAQRSIIATQPGSVFRYVNSGLNVLGAIIRDQIERRGLPYYETLYGLLADRLGMATYQHSADIAGNLIGSGAGFATLRDYAKLGVLYLQDGMWNGERLLPEGWCDYALTSTHTGTSYAACFRSNIDRLFPDLPVDTAWASGASDQRIFILRGHRLTVAVNNETDHPMDLAALNRVIAVAIAEFEIGEFVMTVRNVAREKLERGELSLGVGVRLTRSVEIGKAMAVAGFDWLFLDMEHGVMSLEACAQISVAALDAGIAPIARVPNGEYSIATRALDNGALGIVMPHVDTADEAREVVSKLKYPPIGHRSMGGIGPHYGLRSASTGEAAKALNAANLTVVMLETPTAIANADAIAAVPGVDVLLIGSNDLCAEMGIPGDFGNERVAEAYRVMIAACKKHGKFPGMAGIYNEAIMPRYIEMGARFILSGQDAAFLMAGAAQRTGFLRKTLA